MKTVLPRSLSLADVIITPSNFTKQELLKHYQLPSQKIQVIYEGKDPFFYPITNSAKIDNLRSKYDLGPMFIYSNATNHERKNIFGLISAFSQLTEYSNLQLIITGLLPNQTKRELSSQIAQLKLENRVKFLGYVSKEELRTLYSTAKLFVYPSFEEGFGLPVLEAVACNCLPACSQAGALPEIIGDRSLTFDPHQPAKIAQKIKQLLQFSTSTHKKKLNQLRQHHRQFDWDIAAKAYLTLIKNLE